MRALIQRVKSAKVTVGDRVVGQIGPGILTLLGVKEGDSEKDAKWLVEKIVKMRIFADPEGKMNLSLKDTQGEHLIVSQFTLYGDARSGNRPSFIGAARPEDAKGLYERALAFSRSAGVKTEAGEFQAHMEVSSVNDGPVTLWLESPT